MRELRKRRYANPHIRQAMSQILLGWTNEELAKFCADVRPFFEESGYEVRDVPLQSFEFVPPSLEGPTVS